MAFAHAKIVLLKPPEHTDITTFLKQHHITTIDEYVVWLKENIKYVPDLDNDDWADPLITLNSKKGDCEDMAFLSAAVIRAFGYTPQVLAYGREKEAHVICLFLMEGKYYIFDNTQFYRDITSPSLKEIFTFLAQKHNAEYLLRLERSPKKLDVLYSIDRNRSRS